MNGEQMLQQTNAIDAISRKRTPKVSCSWEY